MGLIQNAGYIGDLEPGDILECAVCAYNPATGSNAGLSFDGVTQGTLWNLTAGTSLDITSGIGLTNGTEANVVSTSIDLGGLGGFADDPGNYMLAVGPMGDGVNTGIKLTICNFSIQYRRLIKPHGADNLLLLNGDGEVTAGLNTYWNGVVQQMYNFLLVDPAAPAYGVKKNKALDNFPFMLRQLADPVAPLTGITPTVQRSIDGAAFANCANAATEISGGAYKIDLATTDLNASRFVVLKFSHASAVTEFSVLRITP